MLANRIDMAIKDAALALHPNIKEALCAEFRGTVTLSMHVQDGVLNHLKSGISEALDLEETGERTKPTQEQTAAVMRAVGFILRGKLPSVLAPGFHGTMLLAMTFESGKLQNAECEAEKVTKPTAVKVGR